MEGRVIVVAERRNAERRAVDLADARLTSVRFLLPHECTAFSPAHGFCEERSAAPQLHDAHPPLLGGLSDDTMYESCEVPVEKNHLNEDAWHKLVCRRGHCYRARGGG